MGWLWLACFFLAWPAISWANEYTPPPGWYLISESELIELETILGRQQATLIEQEVTLVRQSETISQLKQTIKRLETSFAEYESAAAAEIRRWKIITAAAITFSVTAILIFR